LQRVNSLQRAGHGGLSMLARATLMNSVTTVSTKLASLRISRHANLPTTGADERLLMAEQIRRYSAIFEH
jgi:hypothetical protein